MKQNGVADKPVPVPWEDKPYVDHKAAEHKAIAAAQPRYVDPKSPAVVAYARSGFDKEIKRIKDAAEGERQKKLFPAACALYELVAAGALDETDVYNAIRDACRDNRLEQDDGAKSVEDTLRNARIRGFDNPRPLSGVGTKKRSGFDLDDKPVQPIRLDEYYALERGFWTKRDSLQTIYLGALSKMSSPWAVLAHCAARALALVRPNCVLPPIIGGPGSLNWFAAITAESGGGKGSASSTSRLLVRSHIQERNLGSGEGLVDQYVRAAKDGEPAGLYESVMFKADEVDAVDALNKRSGSTLPSVIRSGFSGETLGFSYRGTSDRHLEAQSYRMTFVCSIQPAKSGALLDDKHGGTLQRFMWFPATDTRITSDTPLMPAPLTLPEPSAWLYGRELRIPYEATEIIKDERVRAMRGERDALDGHALFIREKFAYALAILDGRDEMSTEDWMLAGIVSRISDHTRKWVTAELIRITEEEAMEKGRMHGVSLTASSEEQTYRNTLRLSRIAQWVLGKVGTDGVTRRDLTTAIAGRDRPYLQMTLDKLEQAGRIERNGTKRWVRTDV